MVSILNSTRTVLLLFFLVCLNSCASGQILPITNGGTGATSPSTARTNLGLGNVDNTSDANKPVSTAQQTALNGKVSIPGIVLAATSYTISTSDNNKLILVGGNPGNVTLPIATAGFKVDISNPGTGLLTVHVPSGRSMNDVGNGTFVIINQQVVSFSTDGTDWFSYTGPTLFNSTGTGSLVRTGAPALINPTITSTGIGSPHPPALAVTGAGADDVLRITGSGNSTFAGPIVGSSIINAPNFGATDASKTSSFAGGVVPGAAALPTCNLAHAGITWYVPGAFGVKDTYQACIKLADESFAWFLITGIPVVYSSGGSAVTNFDFGPTVVYNTGASGAGLYRATCYVSITRVATTSSTMPACIMTWTDEASNAIVSGNASNTDTSNTLGANSLTSTTGKSTITFTAAASTNISVAAVGYASSGATSMQYDAKIKVEYLGAL